MNQKKFRIKLIATVLGLTVLAVIAANEQFKISQDEVISATSGSRTIASIDPGVRSMDNTAEKALAKTLASKTHRDLASIARQPTEVEKLRFELLEGKYSVIFSGDRIAEISFVDSPESMGRPTYFENRAEFFKTYGKLFGIQGNPERVSIDAKGMKIFENYKAQAATGKGEISIQFVFDDLDRLISVKSDFVAKN